MILLFCASLPRERSAPSRRMNIGCPPNCPAITKVPPVNININCYCYYLIRFYMFVLLYEHCGNILKNVIFNGIYLRPYGRNKGNCSRSYKSFLRLKGLELPKQPDISGYIIQLPCPETAYFCLDRREITVEQLEIYSYRIYALKKLWKIISN
jgi:hypothetical protein